MEKNTTIDFTARVNVESALKSIEEIQRKIAESNNTKSGGTVDTGVTQVPGINKEQQTELLTIEKIAASRENTERKNAESDARRLVALEKYIQTYLSGLQNFTLGEEKISATIGKRLADEQKSKITIQTLEERFLGVQMSNAKKAEDARNKEVKAQETLTKKKEADSARQAEEIRKKNELEIQGIQKLLSFEQTLKQIRGIESTVKNRSDVESVLGQYNKLNSEMVRYGATIDLVTGKARMMTSEERLATSTVSQKSIAVGALNKEMLRTSASNKQMSTSSSNASYALLELSRGFEDAQYGMRGMLNNIPGLLMHLGGGAGLAGAVSIAAVAISILFTTMQSSSAKAAEALKKDAKETADEIKSLHKKLTEDIQSDKIQKAGIHFSRLYENAMNYSKISSDNLLRSITHAEKLHKLEQDYREKSIKLDYENKIANETSEKKKQELSIQYEKNIQSIRAKGRDEERAFQEEKYKNEQGRLNAELDSLKQREKDLIKLSNEMITPTEKSRKEYSSAESIKSLLASTNLTFSQGLDSFREAFFSEFAKEINENPLQLGIPAWPSIKAWGAGIGEIMEPSTQTKQGRRVVEAQDAIIRVKERDKEEKKAYEDQQVLMKSLGTTTESIASDIVKLNDEIEVNRNIYKQNNVALKNNTKLIEQENKNIQLEEASSIQKIENQIKEKEKETLLKKKEDELKLLEKSAKDENESLKIKQEKAIGELVASFSKLKVYNADFSNLLSTITKSITGGVNTPEATEIISKANMLAGALSSQKKENIKRGKSTKDEQVLIDSLKEIINVVSQSNDEYIRNDNNFRTEIANIREQQTLLKSEKRYKGQRKEIEVKNIASTPDVKEGENNSKILELEDKIYLQESKISLLEAQLNEKRLSSAGKVSEGAMTFKQNIPENQLENPQITSALKLIEEAMPDGIDPDEMAVITEAISNIKTANQETDSSLKSLLASFTQIAVENINFANSTSDQIRLHRAQIDGLTTKINQLTKKVASQ